MDITDLEVMNFSPRRFSQFAVVGHHEASESAHHHYDDKAMYHPIILAFAGIASAASLWAGMLAQGKAEPPAGFLNIPNSYLYLVCIAGAIAGGMVSVFILPTIETRKQLIFKFLASSMTSMVTTPRLISWMGWSQAPDSVLITSGAVALVAWGALLKFVPLASEKLLPMAGDYVVRVFKAIFNKKD